MLQLKFKKILPDPSLTISLFLFFLLFIITPLIAQGYDDTFEMKNKLKLEFQYADYFTYEYPEPLVFQYGVQEYIQNKPYLANFPEKRGLVKFTRMLDSKTAFSIKYQGSDLRRDVNSHLGETKITHSFSDALIGLAGIQVINDTRGFNAWQPGIGLRWTVSPLTIIQADAQYYMRGEEAVEVGGQLNSLNLRVKFRQVLTISTAVLIEYLYYGASGENIDFNSHTGSFWLSQFLPTQTALHLNVRYYYNSAGIESLAPSLEIAQYLNWATVLRLKYRYYTNKSENVSLGETDVIIPDNLRSRAVSIQLNREITPDISVYGKYRWYKSNLDIEMNTYLMGFIYSF